MGGILPREIISVILTPGPYGHVRTTEIIAGGASADFSGMP
jgi:hypothetical protein